MRPVANQTIAAICRPPSVFMVLSFSLTFADAPDDKNWKNILIRATSSSHFAGSLRSVKNRMGCPQLPCHASNRLREPQGTPDDFVIMRRDRRTTRNIFPTLLRNTQVSSVESDSCFANSQEKFAEAQINRNCATLEDYPSMHGGRSNPRFKAGTSTPVRSTATGPPAGSDSGSARSKKLTQ